MLFDALPTSWQPELADLRISIDEIGRQLQERADKGERILPDKKWVFRALQMAPSEVRVLIIGQDPYPNAQDACGLAFSVSPRKSGLPGSLLNIQKEIMTDIGSTTTADGDLSRWSEQGVLLLNRVLTVTAGESGSHGGLGWEAVTERIAQICAANGAIGVLWGNSARTLEPLFAKDRLVMGVHPSPLSAHRGFLGSKPFSKINEMLGKSGVAPILW